MWGGLFLALFTLATAQDAAVFSFSGQFDANSASALPVVIDDSDGTCGTVDGTNLYPYTTFNVTFQTAGVRALYAYNGPYAHVTNSPSYNISDLCSYGVFPLKGVQTGGIGSSSSGALYQYGHYFAATTYTFIFFGAYQSTDPFVGEIWEGLYNGQITLSGPNRTWTPLSYDSSGYCYQDTSTEPEVFLYDTQVVNVNTTGYHNVYLAFGQNTALPLGFQNPVTPFFDIIKGDITTLDLSAENCSSLNLVKYIEGDMLNVQGYSVLLTANQNYTVVVHGTSLQALTYYGHYTLIVTAGAHKQMKNTTTFVRPSIYSDTCGSGATTCNDYDSYRYPQAWVATLLPVTANSFAYIAAQEVNAISSGLNDLIFYVYNGSNTGSPVSGPLECGLALGSSCTYGADTLVGQAFPTGTHTQLTVVATDWTDRASGSDGFYNLFSLSGPLIGVSAGASTRAPTQVPTLGTSAPTLGTSAPTPVGGTKAPTTAPTVVTSTPTNPTVSAAPTPPTAVPTRAPAAGGNSMAPTTDSKVSPGVMYQPCVFVLTLGALLLA